jgi:hypothetical protein
MFVVPLNGVRMSGCPAHLWWPERQCRLLVFESWGAAIEEFSLNCWGE